MCTAVMNVSKGQPAATRWASSAPYVCLVLLCLGRIVWVSVSTDRPPHEMLKLTDGSRTVPETAKSHVTLLPRTHSKPLERAQQGNMTLDVPREGVIFPSLQRFVKPLLLEVGVLLIIQAVGFPLIAQLLTSLLAVRRLRPLKFLLSPKHLKTLSTVSSRIWKTLLAAYSKTSASKIVNRSKKIIKSFLPHDEEETENETHTH